jgi:DNA mismatch repair protein MutS
VVNHARAALGRLEASQQAAEAQVDLFAEPVTDAAQSGAFSAVESALETINPDNLSPREALDALYQLKKLQTT